MSLFSSQAARLALLLIGVSALSACHDDNNSNSSATTTATYTIGGTVSGLDGTVVLENNSGDDLTLTSDGSFSFATAVDDNSSYSVTVSTQPDDQVCTVSDGSGAVSSADVTSVAVNCVSAPTATPTASLSYGLKTFNFSWTAVTDATYYQLYENADGNSGFSLIADNLTDTSYSLTDVALYNHVNAEYMVAACNDAGCTDSSTLTVSSTLAKAIGYVKASNAGEYNRFGYATALSKDGNTLVVSAPDEEGDASSTSASPNDNTYGAGAVYVFTKASDGSWAQSGYLKASNAEKYACFGSSVAVSSDGDTIAVGAFEENGDASSTSASPNDNASSAGAVYIFTLTNSSWSQSAYLKASNAGEGDLFGTSLSLSSDGTTLAVAAPYESGDASSTSASPNDNAYGAGAVYVFTYSDSSWSQVAYLKASNAEEYDYFGWALSLSGDGSTLAVGANGEAGDASSTSTDPNNNADGAGAVYIFSSSSWSQTAYLKASDAVESGYFGTALSLSNDGSTLAVGTGTHYISIGVSSTPNDKDRVSASDVSTFANVVYVFSNSDSSWSQTAELTGDNTESGDDFGYAVALSSDGTTLAVSAPYEASDATGIDGSDNNNASDAGAAYVFTLSDGAWSQQHYLKASNTEISNDFGISLAITDDGTLAVGAYLENNDASGVSYGVTSTDDGLEYSGAAYLY
ncbi:FG-GAP repeat protein [Gallaecimonas mangrovi]|uniref:FG-GAP repeat protein n=1 Tax=Gallaecimonas mangrovi TaxID=2291597 RepID=UPI000E2006B2|nr:FG-GAP repeat protein [Gallaecimonas mangrovi]